MTAMARDGEVIFYTSVPGEQHLSPTEARLFARRLFEEAGMAERQRNFPKGKDPEAEKKRTHREYLGRIS